MTQGEIHKITGIGRSSISQYLSGKNEPSQMRKQEIARALGVQETYFEMFEPAATVQHDGVVNLPVTLAAKLMKKSKEWVMQGLRDGVFPGDACRLFGHATTPPRMYEGPVRRSGGIATPQGPRPA